MQVLKIFLELIALASCALPTAMALILGNASEVFGGRGWVILTVALGSLASGLFAFDLFVRVLSLLTRIPV